MLLVSSSVTKDFIWEVFLFPANTCPKIDETQTMKITKFFDGAMLKFSCTVMHKLEGDDKLICDGTNWDHDPPVCKGKWQLDWLKFGIYNL